MAEQLITLFEREIQKALFPANEFYKNSKVDGGINIDARTVEIPQRGASATIIKNPSVFPLTPSQRVDDVKSYDVDQFATEPTHITEKNEIEVNYNKRADILQDHIDVLNTRVADNMAFVWGTTAPTFQTSGANRQAAIAGATGLRKALTYDDFVNVATRFDQDDVPEDMRMGLIDPIMFSDLLKIDQFISVDYMKTKPVSDRVIGEILGIQLFKRSRTVRYATGPAGAKKEITEAVAGADNSAALFWHKNFVRRGEGQVKVYSDFDKPQWLGSIFNAAVRNGGMIGRSDLKGVITLGEAAGV